ncbi:MAG TPA: serine/threonine-protein kinase [Gemmataceae bacterium]|nr:serine/threonine-protein kinase [Gemmataceae bacterium]
MPAPATIDAFLEVLDKSGLVEGERLRLFLQQNSGLSATPRKLASRLVAAGLLTQFQAEQLLLGKHRGFSIGKYRILERIGAGGHSTVYLGEHLVVKRRVAIKVLPMARAVNPASVARFYREARAAGALDHANLVRAYDVDCENGLHFIVMDYVDGSSLQQIVARFGPLSPARSAHYIRQAAQGLQAAHAAGLVHRDIKPANILLDRHGFIRVLDLGLARFFCDNEDPLTLKYDGNNVLGTADYVAPEQALNSHDVDSRADMYSLGATFYFLLAGRPLFPEGKITNKLIWHQTRQPASLRQLRPEVPRELAALVERMIDKVPERRYQTMGELMEALLPWTATPVPPPSEEEMPRLSPAARAAAVAEGGSGSNIAPGRNSWRGDSEEGREKHALPAPRGQTVAEMATPPFFSGQIDTKTASIVAPVARSWTRRKQLASLSRRILSSVLLVLLGVFTGTGIRIGFHREASEPPSLSPQTAEPSSAPPVEGRSQADTGASTEGKRSSETNQPK